MFQFAEGLPRRQDKYAVIVTVTDMVKMCLDSQINLPTFHAVDLARLPPVDMSHGDVSAFIREIQLLRSEVRKSALFREEIDKLQQEVRK